MKIVQLVRGNERRVGVVDNEHLKLLADDAPRSAYSLASQAIAQKRPLASIVEESVGKETLAYEVVYDGPSAWRLLPSFDHPHDPARCMVSGTGLTHMASAENRAAMHKKTAAEVTDSTRMYQMGLESGDPAPGQIGTQPEWFYKGDGSVLRAHGEPLEIPPYACDGGEEPEIAGVYIVSPGGDPFRVGLTIANEFSDHQMEKKNYLYLAPSKLRNCSIGPELNIGEIDFDDMPGSVTVLRNREPIWRKEIWTGQKNMSHSVANLEHHHFKYAAHRRHGDVHIHFFGADAFSFGDGLSLIEGDIMDVSFPRFGRSLRNVLKVSRGPESLVTVKTL